MNISLGRAGLVGATGPTGRHLATSLRRRGVGVRAISRSGENLARCFPDTQIERAEADALDAAALLAAVDGCDLVVDCIGLPPDRMDDHAATAAVVADAAGAVGARCLQISSFWSFLPVRRLPVDETHPREGGNRYARARRAAEDVMLRSGAAVVHLPDFFGPHVHVSTLQRPLQEAVAGRKVNWLGAADIAREYVHVPDAMEAVADLALRDEAYGRSWIVPGSGPLDGNGFARIVADHLGAPTRLRTAPRWLLKAMSLVSPDLRSFAPILDDYLEPIRYDGGRLTALIGTVPATPYATAIPATLDWLRGG